MMDGAISAFRVHTFRYGYTSAQAAALQIILAAVRSGRSLVSVAEAIGALKPELSEPSVRPAETGKDTNQITRAA